MSNAFLRLLTESLVNDIHNISSFFIFNISIKYLILPTIVRVLPEPAPASNNALLDESITASLCFLSSE